MIEFRIPLSRNKSLHPRALTLPMRQVPVHLGMSIVIDAVFWCAIGFSFVSVVESAQVRLWSRLQRGNREGQVGTGRRTYIRGTYRLPTQPNTYTHRQICRFLGS
jgi:hypothetical protein